MSCKITSIKKNCGYNLDGIASIMALDLDDFTGLVFDEDGLYDTSLISGVLKDGDYIEIDAPNGAKYGSTLQNGMYTHTLETFIGELSAELSAALHLATKRRYLVFFRSMAGAYFCFGYGAGATFAYTNQTTDGTGSLVTISAPSIYPLFEAKESALYYERVLGTEDNKVIISEDGKNRFKV